jgi:hypothetical protein
MDLICFSFDFNLYDSGLALRGEPPPDMLYEPNPSPSSQSDELFLFFFSLGCL